MPRAHSPCGVSTAHARGDGGDGASHLTVTLEGGQMIALAVALDEGLDGEARAYICSSPTRTSGSGRTQ